MHRDVNGRFFQSRSVFPYRALREPRRYRHHRIYVSLQTILTFHYLIRTCAIDLRVFTLLPRSLSPFYSGLLLKRRGERALQSNPTACALSSSSKVFLCSSSRKWRQHATTASCFAAGKKKRAADGCIDLKVIQNPINEKLINSLHGTTTQSGSILSSNCSRLPRSRGPTSYRPCRFNSVQQRNFALAGGGQTLDATESEEWLLSQARQHITC